MPRRVHWVAFASVLALVSGASSAHAACAGPDPALVAKVEPLLAKVRPGVAVEVVRAGKTLLSCADGVADLEHGAPVTADTVFRLASVTKPFTAAAVLELAEQGKLSLADPLSRWVPELPAYGAVTLEQLLTHTAAVPDFTEDASYPEHRARDHSPEAMLTWIGQLARVEKAEPGTAWRYSNSGYVLLGVVIARASGLPLAKAYRTLLLDPAGASGVTVDDASDVVAGRAAGYRRDKTRPSGYANAAVVSPTIPGAAGALRGTARATAAWVQSAFDGWVLGPASLAKWSTPGRLNDGRPNRWGMPTEWREGWKADYSLGWFVDERGGRRRLYHSGDIDGFTTRLAHYPDQDLTVVILSNVDSWALPGDAVEDAALATLAGAGRAPTMDRSAPSSPG
jgi:CubicO group peptidase (beta-lactamase class C family)